MGKISQSSAIGASLKIVEPINKKIQEVNKEIKELLTGYYRATVPAELLEMWKKHSEYMKSASSINPKGVGISKSNNESIESSPGKGSWSPDTQLSKEQESKYLKLVDKRDDLKEKYKTIQKEIEATILTLGTHKRVAEQFPEVIKFFPESTKQNMQLTVQLAPVREKVRCLVSPDKDKKCIEKL